MIASDAHGGNNNAMKYILLVTFFSLVTFPAKTAMAGFFGPVNLWECIIEEMPGTKNDPAAREIFKNCKKRFPGSDKVKKKSSLFGVTTAGECVVEHGKDITSPVGARLLFRACANLYPKE